jgi:hypothetical protein
MIWLALALGREVTRRGAFLTPAFSCLMIFWAVFAIAESLGTFTAYTIGDTHDPGLFLHDVVAYPLMAALSCLIAAGPEAEARLHQVTTLFVGFGAIFLLPQLAAGWNLVGLPVIEPWFGDRFRGWSNNPNQLALLCAALVLLALHLADRAMQLRDWVVAVASSIPPLLVGRLTKTDAFTFALIVGALAFTAVKLRIWATSRETRSTLRSGIAVISAIGLPLMLVSVAPLMSSAVNPDVLAKGLMKDGGKEGAQEADLRLRLWDEAIARGLDSWGLGLGPGPHLPIPVSITAAREAEPGLDTGDHPQLNGTPNFESHNTIFDLFVQGGLLASLSYVWLTAMAFVASYRARMAGLTALLTGLTIFALLDLVVREPIFWFGVACCLVAGNRTWRGASRVALEATRPGM